MIRTLYYIYKNWQYRAQAEHLSLLKSAQGWTAEAISQYQQDRLAEILRAAHQSKFYKTVINKCQVNPDHFRVDQLIKLPILTRDIIRRQPTDLVTGNIEDKGIYRNQTGGSTGEPIHLWQDQYYHATAQAALSYGFYLCNWQPGDRQLFIWGSDYDAKLHETTIGKAYDWLNNSYFVNAFNLEEKVLAKTAQLILEKKPKFIWSYVSSIELLSRYLQKQKIFPQSIQSIQTTAEVLTLSTRQLIEETFGARVFDRYGSREVSLIAHECFASRASHIIPLNNYVELLDANDKPVKAGEIGRIVITNLHNRIMPLIRYEIGDLAQWKGGKCGCGRSWPRLKKIIGRKTDIIYSPSGKYIHGEFFTHLFYKIGHVRQFQVEQTAQDQLIIRIVKEENFDDEKNISFLKKIIAEEADPRFRLKFEFPSRISVSNSGKFRFTFSNLKHPLNQY